MSHLGILFDLDGVLIDSEGTYSRFWADIDRRFPTGIDNFAVHIKGTTLPSILNYFPDPTLRQLIVRELNTFQDNMQFTLFPDTLPFLEMLRYSGIPAAIVTSSDPAKMQRLYRQHPSFKSMVSVVIDASKVTHSKPHPEGYLLAADALGLPPDSCIVFEDSLQGLKAGRASGAKVIAMATTYPADRLTPLADRVISRLSEISLPQLLAL